MIANAATEPVGFSAEPGATPRIKGGMLVSGNYFRVLGVEPQLGRGFRDDEDEVARPRCRGGARAGFLEARIRERPFRRRQDDSPERHGLHRDRRRAGDVPGHADLRRARFLHAAGDGAGVFDQPAEELLRGPRRSRAEREGAAEARHDACSRRRASWPCSRRIFEREYPQLNREPRRGGAHAVRDADAGRRRELEIQRDLRGPGARQCCWWRAPTWPAFS